MSHLGEKDFYDRDLVRAASQENIMKGLYGGLPEENDIQKAEGSRGGKIIGHTKSGKPIYADKQVIEYKNFTHQDHNDAAETHHAISEEQKKEAISTGNEKLVSRSSNHKYLSSSHKEESSKLAKEELEKERLSKLDHSHLIHTEAKRIAREAGISHEEYEKLHPLTKIELSKHHPPKSEEQKKEFADKFKDSDTKSHGGKDSEEQKALSKK